MTDNIIKFPEIKISKISRKSLAASSQFLYDNWHNFYKNHLPGKNITTKTHDHFFDYLDKNKANTFIAIRHKKIIGLVSIFQNCIDELWVDENYRCQKIGKKLVDNALERIVEKKYLSAQVGCEDFNQDAIKFFKKLGWYMIDSETIALNNQESFSVIVLGYKL